MRVSLFLSNEATDIVSSDNLLLYLLFQFHARMLSSEVAQSLKSYRHFRTLRPGSLLVTAMLYFSGKTNTSIHGLGEDVMASLFM